MSTANSIKLFYRYDSFIFFTRSVKNLQHWKRCSEKNTSVHILKSPCFETNKGGKLRKLQSIDTLKYLFNGEKLEKNVKMLIFSSKIYSFPSFEIYSFLCLLNRVIISWYVILHRVLV